MSYPCIKPYVRTFNPALPPGGMRWVNPKEAPPGWVRSWQRCRRCTNCRLWWADQWVTRMSKEAMMYPAEEVRFWTFTLAKSDGSLNREHLVAFWRYLSRDATLGKPKPLFYAAGEYGTKNRRPHYHAITYGWRVADDDPGCTFWTKSPGGALLYRHMEVERVFSEAVRSLDDPANVGGICTFQPADPTMMAYIAKYIVKGHFIVEDDERPVVTVSPEKFDPEQAISLPGRIPNIREHITHGAGVGRQAVSDARRPVVARALNTREAQSLAQQRAYKARRNESRDRYVDYRDNHADYRRTDIVNGPVGLRPGQSIQVAPQFQSQSRGIGMTWYRHGGRSDADYAADHDLRARLFHKDQAAGIEHDALAVEQAQFMCEGPNMRSCWPSGFVVVGTYPNLRTVAVPEAFRRHFREHYPRLAEAFRRQNLEAAIREEERNAANNTPERLATYRELAHMREVSREPDDAAQVVPAGPPSFPPPPKPPSFIERQHAGLDRLLALGSVPAPPEPKPPLIGV